MVQQLRDYGTPEALSVAKKLCECGTVLSSREGVEAREVELPGGGTRITVLGLAHCDRHLCPKCGSWSAAQRREQVLERVPEAMKAGRSFHAVLTLRHHLGVEWLALADTERTIWRRQQQRKQWRTSVVGFFRANEVTYGDNGFHHHIHSVLTLPRDQDPEEFKAWLQDFWHEQAKELGRSTDWQDGWWSEIETEEELESVVRYGTKHSALGHVAAAEVLGDAAKSSAPWNLPVEQYCEVWMASRRHRWFGVGGCWRSPKEAEEVETEPELVEAVSETGDEIRVEREAPGELVARIPLEAWVRLSYEQRSWLLGIAHNRSHASWQIAEAWGQVVQAYLPTPSG